MIDRRQFFAGCGAMLAWASSPAQAGQQIKATGSIEKRPVTLCYENRVHADDVAGGFIVPHEFDELLRERIEDLDSFTMTWVRYSTPIPPVRFYHD